MKPWLSFLRQRGALAALAVLVLLALAPVHAQDAPAEEDVPPAPTEEVADDIAPLSPRAALDDYLTLCRQSRFEEAAAYLPALPEPEKAAEAARRLKIVLDRHIWFDMSQISGAREGDTDDGLPDGREQLGTFETAGGNAVVEMVRTAGDDPPGWVFAAGTIRRVDAWYAELGRSWLQDRLPAWLLRSGPLELQWWQWAALPVALLLAWLIARLVVSILRPILLAWTRRSTTEIDDLLVDRLAAPATLFLLLLVFRSLISQVDLVIPAHEFIARLVRGAVLAGVFWTLMRLVEVALAMVQRLAWLSQRQGLAVMTPFLGRAIRTVVLALGAITILQEFGFQVTGLLAGMGLAGMAVALAGQKTVENLIGSGTILADQPFRPGDFVRIGDLIGTVEVVGLRSTRIRTLDRTVVTLPNGALAEMRLETFAARDRCRLLCTLGLTYATRVERMKKIMSALEDVLRTHPRVGDDPVRVRFVEFGASSLNIEVLAYVLTTDWAEFVGLRQELYLRFMEVVEANGGEFAFPTRTVHVESLPRATASVPDGRAS